MPPEIKADQTQGFRDAGQEVTKPNEMDGLMPPDIRAEAQNDSLQRSQQQSNGLGL